MLLIKKSIYFCSGARTVNIAELTVVFSECPQMFQGSLFLYSSWMIWVMSLFIPGLDEFEAEIVTILDGESRPTGNKKSHYTFQCCGAGAGAGAGAGTFGRNRSWSRFTEVSAPAPAPGRPKLVY
jgi:hypothetical protein